MSGAGGSDLLTLPIDHVLVKQEEGEEYLCDVSSRHKPWDTHRGEADDVSDIFANSHSSRHSSKPGSCGARKDDELLTHRDRGMKWSNGIHASQRQKKMTPYMNSGRPVRVLIPARR